MLVLLSPYYTNKTFKRVMLFHSTEAQEDSGARISGLKSKS